MRDFRKLNAWKKSHKFNLKLYQITSEFPEKEKFGITSQIRRSGVSIAANIAEGSGHFSKKAYRRYINLAIASASETDYLLLLCKDISLINEEEFYELSNELIEIKKMLYTLSVNLKKSLSKPDS